MINPAFWAGKEVFVTGHTGFKGAWLCLLLKRMGARIHGYSLAPPTSPSLFELADVHSTLAHSEIGDVRDLASLTTSLRTSQATIALHMAAQPLVRESYRLPIETYATNVMGTAHFLEAVRQSPSIQAAIVVTTDKCYENRNWHFGYREIDALGGHDPYSSSKACAELVTQAYVHSYFNRTLSPAAALIATTRAGNVIGGGDFSADRLVPDCVRAFLQGECVTLRNPHATRPWQHVLEALCGYLMLAERLAQGDETCVGAFNLGPREEDVQTVEQVVAGLTQRWFTPARYQVVRDSALHEAHTLKLDCSKARNLLGYQPVWSLAHTLETIVEWTRAYQQGESIAAVCQAQIDRYLSQHQVETGPATPEPARTQVKKRRSTHDWKFLHPNHRPSSARHRPS